MIGCSFCTFILSPKWNNLHWNLCWESSIGLTLRPLTNSLLNYFIYYLESSTLKKATSFRINSPAAKIRCIHCFVQSPLFLRSSTYLSLALAIFFFLLKPFSTWNEYQSRDQMLLKPVAKTDRRTKICGKFFIGATRQICTCAHSFKWYKCLPKYLPQ